MGHELGTNIGLGTAINEALSCSNGIGCFGVFTTGFWWKKNVKLSSTSICLPVDSIMAWYLSLESGNFSFPTQVYNRENGNVGFLLSCYDAKASYDSNTNSFKARYLAHDRPTTEENIGWERLRLPAVGASPYDLHVSDCLTDLQPGDHFEIQWRKSKEFPYRGCSLVDKRFSLWICMCVCNRCLFLGLNRVYVLDVS